jgi:hypothetical protein
VGEIASGLGLGVTDVCSFLCARRREGKLRSEGGRPDTLWFLPLVVEKPPQTVWAGCSPKPAPPPALTGLPVLGPRRYLPVPIEQTPALAEQDAERTPDDVLRDAQALGLRLAPHVKVTICPSAIDRRLEADARFVDGAFLGEWRALRSRKPARASK